MDFWFVLFSFGFLVCAAGSMRPCDPGMYLAVDDGGGPRRASLTGAGPHTDRLG